MDNASTLVTLCCVSSLSLVPFVFYVSSVFFAPIGSTARALCLLSAAVSPASLLLPPSRILLSPFLLPCSRLQFVLLFPSTSDCVPVQRISSMPPVPFFRLECAWRGCMQAVGMSTKAKRAVQTSSILSCSACLKPSPRRGTKQQRDTAIRSRPWCRHASTFIHRNPTNAVRAASVAHRATEGRNWP